MRGKISDFKTERGFGFIAGEDNQSYYFHISKVSNPKDIRENYSVEFSAKRNEKGLTALDITVHTPLASGSRDKILKIKDLRIRASEIKEYELKKHTSFSSQDDDGNVSYKLYKEGESDSKRNYDYDDDDFYYKLIYVFSFDYMGDKLDTFLSKCKPYDYSKRVSHITRNPVQIKLVDEFGCSEDMGTDGFTFYEDQINSTYYIAQIEENVRQNQYEIAIKTYTSGDKSVSCASDIEEANELLDYLDDELSKLL